MTRDVAKFILRAYRVDGQDQSDPQVADALEMVKRDPELARWFAEEQALDSRLARSFGAFPVPQDLKTQLLAARQVIVVPFWRRHPVWLAAAAAVVILLGIVFAPSPWRSGPALAEYQPEEILRFAAQGPHATTMVGSLADTRKWLATAGLPANLELSGPLASLRYKGCRTVAWRGRTVAMVCLFDGARHLDLFVFNHGSTTAGLPGEQPEFAQVSGLATATWTRAGHTYLLAAHDAVAPEILKRYL
ncbi:MAG: DUF3379 family protein [Verrucomicrobia bacterium]|nr:DUF3379 family protein [Verrucomicrobiota bacterium]